MKSEAIFAKFGPHLEKEGAAVVKKVGAVFLFELKEKKGAESQYFTLDLKNGNGKFSAGKVGKADATFCMLDEVMVQLSEGKIDPQTAFTKGALKIKGNMAKAMKFTPDLLPKDAKL